MITTYIVFLHLCYFPLTWSWVQWYPNKYRGQTVAHFLPDRLIHLMEVYHQEGRQRLRELNEMRFMYEETPHYEQGYVMSEVIERYRKMVLHVKRPMYFLSDTVFDTLKRTELIQKLYFEIVHLIKMAHEIARKYKFMPEFVSIENPVDILEIYEAQQEAKVQEKMERRDKKKTGKFMKKLDTMIAAQVDNKPVNKKEYNKHWPIDYGWEIDYYW